MPLKQHLTGLTSSTGGGGGGGGWGRIATMSWKVIKMILILSHGPSGIERGFSVNKDIATAIM